MTDKRKPTYDLDAFKAAFSQPDRLNITTRATLSAAGLGFGRVEISAIIQTMLREHFYKSMTSKANYKVWQDVYHVPSEVGVLYVKFMADTMTDFRLLSFKEKEDHG